MILRNVLVKSDICDICTSEAQNVYNISIKEALKEPQPFITFLDLRPGICETTFLIQDGRILAHKNSRSLLDTGQKGAVYLRHKEFLLPLLRLLRVTETTLSAKIPAIMFNLETQNNPTCRYPPSEFHSGRIRAVKGIIHHSFCSQQLCNGVTLLPISYNQEIAAMEATANLDSSSWKVPWSKKKDKLFWRGSNAGKAREYAFFGWKEKRLPRAKAVALCRSRKNIDVNFGFVPWQAFMKHKYILALAGNTYSSLFKHALRSGSCILRQQERMYEWFEPFLLEWKHYIPVSWDLSDLFSRLEWVKRNEGEAQKIAKNARDLGTALFSRQFMVCYSYCSLQRFHHSLRINFDEVSKYFVEVKIVCNSKRGKRKDCTSLEY